MIEIQVYPLTDVEFVLIVALADEFDQVVSFLANPYNRIYLCQSIKRKITTIERQEDDMNQRFDTIELPHQLLSDQHILISLLHDIILFF